MIKYVFSKKKGEAHQFETVSHLPDEQVLRGLVPDGHYSDVNKIMYKQDGTIFFCSTQEEIYGAPELYAAINSHPYGKLAFHNVTFIPQENV